MASRSDGARADSEEFASFPESRWSILREASDRERRAQVLEYLGLHYWKPVYTYIRRRGLRHEDAKDVTQECFARLASGDTLAAVKEQSRFRTWLRAVAAHVIADRARIDFSQKRKLAAIEALREPVEVEESGTPDESFDREWLKAVERRAGETLFKRMTTPRDARRRRVLEIYLLPRLRGDTAPERRHVATQLGCTVSDVDNDLRAIRALAEPFVRQAVHDTVSSPDEIDAEIEELRKPS